MSGSVPPRYAPTRNWPATPVPRCNSIAIRFGRLTLPSTTHSRQLRRYLAPCLNRIVIGACLSVAAESLRITIRPSGRPIPQLRAGEAIAPHAHAMMDVSDGLLLDARRMAEAGGVRISIDLDTLPLSSAFVAERGSDLQAHLFAATGGDDYALLAALDAAIDPATLCLPQGTRITRVGTLSAGEAMISLIWRGEPIELPERLGFEHKGDDRRGFSASPMADRP